MEKYKEENAPKLAEWEFYYNNLSRLKMRDVLDNNPEVEAEFDEEYYTYKYVFGLFCLFLALRHHTSYLSLVRTLSSKLVFILDTYAIKYIQKTKLIEISWDNQTSQLDKSFANLIQTTQYTPKSPLKQTTTSTTTNVQTQEPNVKTLNQTIQF